MIIAWFTTVCGEATTTAGIFTEKDLIEKEYMRFKEQFESDEEGNKALPYETMEVKKDESFEWECANRILIDILPDLYYDIDWGYDGPIPRSRDSEPGREGDFLMIDLSTINDDDVQFVYMVKNKFVCSSEAFDYLPQKRLINEAIVIINK